MANINLLPWRAERRKLREREFYMMLLGTAVAAFAVLLAAILWMGHLIDNQDERNAYLQDQIKGLDKQIEEIAELDKTRSALLTRKEIIEQLQSNRSQMVHLFDEMVKTIPDGARLTSMKQAGDVLTLEGIAESNSRVASYMRNIDVSPWMGHSDLGKIENQSGSKDVDKKMPYAFSLDVKLHKPKDDQTDAASGVQPAPAGNTGAGEPNKPSSATPAPINSVKPAAEKPAADKPAAAKSAVDKSVGNSGNPTAAPTPQATTPATGEKK